MKMQIKRLAIGCVVAMVASSLLASPSAAKNPSVAHTVINGQSGHPWNGASVLFSLANQPLTTAYLPLQELSTPKLALSKPGRYYGTKVLKSNVDEQGLMTASIRTRLKKGRPIWVTVFTCDTVVTCKTEARDDRTIISEKKFRVKKRGRALFTVSIAANQFVYVWDKKDRPLLKWMVITD
ncbi:hypothetical protein N9D51_01850 [Actinomycetota bacterium]|jgi:hypothetical protein|nr:hypothetical protein [Actinomycetota bacterium]